ncbi:hypothetical protein LX64_03986 [Chitinophaga skermanii]|uniref:Uncharacterized protein n=1 Tax=Chitinophaga skermanii TaxID=331697 RepID=A0A327Q8R5_9BACT|nr:DUF6766 family protein [Chitinophaga skermanii]RAJ00284.1 hypothetical protein LX64_03986 [Chitinophaga skermanii]
MKQPHGFFYRNGLTITFMVLLIVFLSAQAYTGWIEYNKELKEDHESTITLLTYLSSPHFMEATFENWESEFLQMGLYVILTVKLRQKGSAESKSLDEKEEVDREPQPHAKAPWAVKKGGFILNLYKYSLSIAFILLFLGSFILHFKGSMMEYNTEQAGKGAPLESASEYFTNTKFWFESFQNWQSEFLSVAAIVFLSIYLRQYGSPESKPVDAPDDETG